ncbi:Predicted membrane fusion protein (MFP) component of efflux pump, membrane anchor protein YbhG [Vibrio harveyi]|uniref:HlyD family secretion protein n=1 Tax=Vibrio harveyi TaxID=669 RepID=UPI002895B8A4|nr:Predicted membrane fusion protein (MFP) component of efflux pump, membrane anchor protein YbhG [Vibrio harveyi]CAH1548299.1 Predicted membrane fusion protein (MFP) component of efflux pump, membrane anchor protein YbhG [Vibrio harveyi]CAH1552609.1 Predicted membrane fusion protein (MFP) component of efflux pump, membrane anchor protein YbhG [Vibrio harveyi]
MMKRIILGTFVITLLTACSKDDGQQALGTLERDRVTFTATSSEIIRALPIKEGSQVTEGEVLVQLDTKNQEAILARAVAEQARADAYLLKLTNGERPEDIAAAQARVARAEAQLTEAQKNYQRKAELERKKLISQSEKDTALAARDSARAELDSSQEEFSKLTTGSRPEDIEQAKAELMAAKADVALQQQKLAELTITATRDGLLDNLPFNLGERVPVNGIVAVIQASRVPYARVYVPATYRVNFIPGKAVQVHVDGVEKPLEGTVRWVATEPSFTPYFALTEEERSRLMYLAEVDLQDSAESLPSGIPAQVDLVE